MTTQKHSIALAQRETIQLKLNDGSTTTHQVASPDEVALATERAVRLDSLALLPENVTHRWLPERQDDRTVHRAPAHIVRRVAAQIRGHFLIQGSSLWLNHPYFRVFEEDRRYKDFPRRQIRVDDPAESAIQQIAILVRLTADICWSACVSASVDTKTAEAELESRLTGVKCSPETTVASDLSARILDLIPSEVTHRHRFKRHLARAAARRQDREIEVDGSTLRLRCDIDVDEPREAELELADAETARRTALKIGRITETRVEIS